MEQLLIKWVLQDGPAKMDIWTFTVHDIKPANPYEVIFIFYWLTVTGEVCKDKGHIQRVFFISEEDFRLTLSAV